nr:unnamed protein product [Digitaria exilis]
MSRRDHNQWRRPGHGYDPRASAAAQWYAAASTSFPGPGAAPLPGMNPYGFAPNPFAPNPFNALVGDLLLCNPAALASYQQLQQQQQVHHFPSQAYHQTPTSNIQHRPTKPAAAASPAPPPTQPQQPLPRNQQAVLDRAQAAARKAQEELVKSGEGVTGWKVAQAVLLALKVDSWGSLGIQLQDVPLLRDLFLIEGKVNAFIHCYVAARKIVTVYDLEVEICKNEGLGQFEELGLGPFLQHPLVAHYFSVPSDLSVVPKLSSEEILNVLQKFLDISKKKITVEDFLNYLSEQKSVSGKERLGVRIQSLGLHISFLRQARQTEVSAVKLLGNKSGSGHSFGNDSKLLWKNINREEKNNKFLFAIPRHWPSQCCCVAIDDNDIIRKIMEYIESNSKVSSDVPSQIKALHDCETWVQNADDNVYPEDVEPTLSFILQENGIVVLNNERGFSAENIRALCDIGNSTKKGSNRGYIGNKGIGFKSVFRVTDAPEIHSNGFHVKFDITDGQIGFVLPTAVPPYNTTSFSRMLSVEDDKDTCSLWNTCILLPFRSKFREGTASSMDEDLHYATDLFYDVENVRSLIGSAAPYAAPQISSSSLRKDIGFKTEVSYCDALMVLKSWITSQAPFSASMSQMCKFYNFLSEGVADSKIDIKREFLSSPSIFTPLQRPRSSEVFRVFVRWANENDKMNILYLKESLQKIETTILPTTVDKWVSLHPSFGLVCWVDDDELKQQFKNSSDVNFIQFGDLSFEDKQMLSGRVAALMKSLGIQALSKVVYREAIFYGAAENREKGNTLYATQDADSHSVLLELSRVFFDGSPDLHFANFLHMIKTMAESGTSAERTESFIINNQNVPELPEHEAIWSFSSLSAASHCAANQGADPEVVEFQPACEFSAPNHQKAPVMVSSWPLNHWRTAPVFKTPLMSHQACTQEAKVNDAGHSSDLSMPAPCGQTEDTLLSVDLDGDWIIEENTRTETTLLADNTTAILDEPQMVMSVDPSDASAYLEVEAGSSSPTVRVELTNFNEKLANLAEERNGLHPDANQLKTGRLGEALVHRHLAEQLGSNNVKWVNDKIETGLPYDIIITHSEGFTEYVEVKTTVSSRKDWFDVTPREWQFAVEQGDLFSIARVVLSSTKKASVEMFKNPHKLYKQKALRLGLLISK